MWSFFFVRSSTSFFKCLILFFSSHFFTELLFLLSFSIMCFWHCLLISSHISKTFWFLFCFLFCIKVTMIQYHSHLFFLLICRHIFVSYFVFKYLNPVSFSLSGFFLLHIYYIYLWIPGLNFLFASSSWSYSSRYHSKFYVRFCVC